MIISQILYLYGNEQDRWMDNYIRSFYQILEASNWLSKVFIDGRLVTWENHKIVLFIFNQKPEIEG